MKRSGWARRVLPAIALLVFAAGSGGGFGSRSTSGHLQAAPGALPEGSRLSPRLRALLDLADPSLQVPVVVTTDRPAGAEDEAEAGAAGAVVSRRFSRLDGYAASLPVGALRRLAAGRGIRQVAFDADVRSANDLNYRTVGADIAGRSVDPSGHSLDGAGVTVAVLDSGIATHPDLAGRVGLQVNLAGHGKGLGDDFGHGTHVAGVISGDGRASAGAGSFRRFNGVAPAARLISVRVLDAKGSGRLSDVLAGIDWVLTNRDSFDIRVLNLSLGRPVEEPYADDPLCRAVERAWRAGIVVVVAAGNAGAAGYGSIHSPGNDPYVITVGAANNYRTGERTDDILTTYTSRGPTPLDHVVKPDLVAPGNRTISLRVAGSTLDRLHPELRIKEGAFRDDPAGADRDSAYFQLSGSSQAAGVVSGMAALMIQADPALTPDTVKARLMKAAEKNLGYDIFSEGAGFAELPDALALTEVAAGPALSPVATWSETGIRIEDPAGRWGAGDAWAVEQVFGPDPLRRTGQLWADAGFWTSETDSSGLPPGLADHSVVWGGGRKSGGASNSGADSVVWGGGVNGQGTADSTADSVVWGGGVMGENSSLFGADSVVWGGGMKGPDSSTLSADSVVWGGGAKGRDSFTVTADSVVWGGGAKGKDSFTVTADSVVWGGGARSDVDTTLLGDNNPIEP